MYGLSIIFRGVKSVSLHNESGVINWLIKGIALSLDLWQLDFLVFFGKYRISSVGKITGGAKMRHARSMIKMVFGVMGLMGGICSFSIVNEGGLHIHMILSSTLG